MRKNFIPAKLYRKIITLIPICCVDLVIKMDNSFLLIKRRENPAKNKWWFPGGRVLFNENLQSVVKRKLKEELGIKETKRIEFLGVGETKFKKGKFGKPVHTINNVFLVEIEKKESKNIEICPTSTRYKWFNKIQGGFHPYIKTFITKSKKINDRH